MFQNNGFFEYLTIKRGTKNMERKDASIKLE